MRHKKILFFIIAIISIVGVLAVTLRNNQLSDTEIRKKFGCGEVGNESYIGDVQHVITPGDIYCNNPSQYREDLKNNQVLSNKVLAWATMPEQSKKLCRKVGLFALLG